MSLELIGGPPELVRGNLRPLTQAASAEDVSEELERTLLFAW